MSNGDGVLFCFFWYGSVCGSKRHWQQDRYSVRCVENDGDGRGVRPLSFLDFRSGNKRWQSTSNIDGVLFYFFWWRSGRYGSYNNAYDEGNGKLGRGNCFICRYFDQFKWMQTMILVLYFIFSPDFFSFLSLIFCSVEVVNLKTCWGSELWCASLFGESQNKTTEKIAPALEIWLIPCILFCFLFGRNNVGGATPFA